MTALRDLPTPVLQARLRTWKLRRTARQKRLNAWHKKRTSNTPRTNPSPAQKTVAVAALGRSIAEANTAILALNEAIAWRKMPMRLRALAIAREDIGIREQGGNNRGAQVMERIRANGGTGPEPWCGDEMAWCYRKAGSKAVTRMWAAVRNLGRIAGLRILKGVHYGLPGDLVCFLFAGGGDHVGMLVGYCDSEGRPMRAAGATHVHTIDGNSSGDDVSDSARGGDGVGEQIRPIALVDRVVRVLR